MVVNTSIRTLFMFIIAAIVTSATVFALPAWSTAKELTSLDALAMETARKLKDQLGEKRLYVDKTFIRDGITGETSNLSSMLRNELEASLSQNGFRLADDIKDADYFVTISYQKDKQNLRVFIKHRKAGSSGSYASISQSIRLDYLPPDTFTENLASTLKKLSSRLIQNLHGQKIFISPVVEGSQRYTSDFSRYVTSYVRSAIAASGQAEVVEAKPVMRSLQVTRELNVKAGKVTRLETSAAVMSDADAHFEGFYAPDSKFVHISLVLKDLQGKVLAAADERIERSLITMNLENPEAKILAEKADVANEGRDRMVKISTTKGDKYQVYYKGEEVQFHVMVAKPLYVHIYNISPDGKATLLYPNEHEAGKPLQSKLLYTIPSANEDWSIVVDGPSYGTEFVKAFACERDIKLPRIDGSIASRSFSGQTRNMEIREKIQKDLSTRISINQDDLVDYYRGAAKAAGAALYEDTFFLQTKEK